MGDSGDYWKDVRECRQADIAGRSLIASGQHESQAARLQPFGIRLVRYTDFHYALLKPNEWRIDLYPTTFKIIPDRKYGGNYVDPPRIRRRRDWTLASVVDDLIGMLESRQSI